MRLTALVTVHNPTEIHILSTGMSVGAYGKFRTVILFLAVKYT